MEPASEPEGDKKITVRKVMSMEEGEGCQKPEFTFLTLCVRAVQNFPYANNKAYRENQEEAKKLISEGFPLNKLKEVKKEWEAIAWSDNPREDKMKEVMTTIKENTQIIKVEDAKHFPDFANIKNKWNALTRQVQDLNTIAIRAASENKINSIEKGIAANRIRNQEISTDVLDNKDNINILKI